MAEPITVTIAGGGALATLAAAAGASDLVQGIDAYQSLMDPGAGCTFEAEPFELKRPPKGAEPQEPDKNRSLRPEGAKPEARADKPATSAGLPPPVPVQYNDEDLLSVTAKVSSLEWFFGEFREPIATVSLDFRVVGEIAICTPYLRQLRGFDSRIGHQVSFVCKVLNHGDGAATIVTRGLFNPFMKESGHLTCWHHVTFAESLAVKPLGARWAPSQAFVETRSGAAYKIRPSD